MSTERDIIIERLEQKLAAKDKEFAQMQETLRESILTEMEKRFSDKIKLRESTLDDIKAKLGEKINEIHNEILEMKNSLKDSLVEKQNAGMELMQLGRIEKVEHRLVELNSAYDGVMRELLDQKSIIQELRPRKPKEEVRPKQEAKPKEAPKPPEKERPKTQYIVADNYVPQKKKQNPVIEAEEKPIDAEEKAKEQLKEQLKKPALKKSERIMEGVEISETLKRGK